MTVNYAVSGSMSGRPFHNRAVLTTNFEDLDAMWYRVESKTSESVMLYDAPNARLYVGENAACHVYINVPPPTGCLPVDSELVDTFFYGAGDDLPVDRYSVSMAHDSGALVDVEAGTCAPLSSTWYLYGGDSAGYTGWYNMEAIEELNTEIPAACQFDSATLSTVNDDSTPFDPTTLPPQAFILWNGLMGTF